MTIHQLLNIGTSKLKSKSTSPALDAEVLLSYVLKKSKEYLYINPKKYLVHTQVRTYLKLINKRVQGWPVADLTNQKEFYGLKFYVDKNVLIPRPETEGLVEHVLEHIKNMSGLKILDIGTGSGNIIISIARRNVPKNVPTKQSIIRSPRPDKSGLAMGNKFFASDVSSKTLIVAKKNTKRHKVKITFKQGDLLNPWKNKHFDIIVANLPYLAQETDHSTKFEPQNALIAEKKGLALYEKLFRQLSSPLYPHPSTLFLEIGYKQAQQIKKLAKKFLPASETKIYKDLSDRDRYAIISL